MNINWLATILIGALIGALLSMPMSILGNLLTPRLVVWYASWSISTRGKTIAQLKKEHGDIETLHNNPAKLLLLFAKEIVNALAVVFMALFVMIALFLTLILMSSVGFGNLQTPGWDLPNHLPTLLYGVLVVVVLVLIVMNFIYFSLRNFYRTLSKLNQFEEYSKKTLSRIAELEEIRSAK